MPTQWNFQNNLNVPGASQAPAPPADPAMELALTIEIPLPATPISHWLPQIEPPQPAITEMLQCAADLSMQNRNEHCK